MKQKSFCVQLKSRLCELNIESQYRKHYDQVGIYVHWLLCNLVHQNIPIKQQEKTDKYQDLKIELPKVWNIKAMVIRSYRCSWNCVKEIS